MKDTKQPLPFLSYEYQVTDQQGRAVGPKSRFIYQTETELIEKLKQAHIEKLKQAHINIVLYADRLARKLCKIELDALIGRERRAQIERQKLHKD